MEQKISYLTPFLTGNMSSEEKEKLIAKEPNEIICMLGELGFLEQLPNAKKRYMNIMPKNNINIMPKNNINRLISGYSVNRMVMGNIKNYFNTIRNNEILNSFFTKLFNKIINDNSLNTPHEKALYYNFIFLNKFNKISKILVNINIEKINIFLDKINLIIDINVNKKIYNYINTFKYTDTNCIYIYTKYDTFRQFIPINQIFQSLNISNELTTKISNIYDYWVDVNGDGACYYRAVFGGLLYNIIFNPSYNSKKIYYIDKLIVIFNNLNRLDIANKQNIIKIVYFLKEIKEIENFEQFSNKFSLYDKFIVISLKYLLYYEILEYDKSNSKIFNLDVEASQYQCNTKQYYLDTIILDLTRNIEGLPVNAGLLVKALGSKYSFFIERTEQSKIELKINEFNENDLPPVNIYLRHTHYVIMIQKFNIDIYNNFNKIIMKMRYEKYLSEVDIEYDKYFRKKINNNFITQNYNIHKFINGSINPSEFIYYNISKKDFNIIFYELYYKRKSPFNKKYENKIYNQNTKKTICNILKI